MRHEQQLERLRIASLKELDALVGRYVTKEAPQVFWEEEQVCLRFDSLEEALEAMHDPYFQQFIPSDARAHSALTEVQEFRPYTSDLEHAWEVVQQLSANAEILCVRRVDGCWLASFGERPAASSRSAPVAICLAALRACGLEVELEAERPVSRPHDEAAA
jgi:hypothetical protein